MSPRAISSPNEMAKALRAENYLADSEIAIAAYLAIELGKPILCEGPPGVGKTSLAKALAAALGRELIRLQCYEGLDESKALYEWQYAKQLLYVQLMRDKAKELTASSNSLAEATQELLAQNDAFFTEDFLLPRPLLQAIRSPAPSLLLIDEVDRADEELEALFLELLGEFQITIPELGTLRAPMPPLVILTSNNTRELSEALRRRCLHLYIDHPSADRERAIVAAHLPDIDEALVKRLVSWVSSVRKLPLKKTPSVSETLDWAQALSRLGLSTIDDEAVRNTLGLLLKHLGDKERVLDAMASDTIASIEG